MARSGTGRGTRMGKGVLSGTTLTTIPSGVTISRGGIGYTGTTKITPTEITFLDGTATSTYGIGYATAAYKFARGIACSAVEGATGVGASHTLTLATGLSTIVDFQCSVRTPAAVLAGVSYCTWAPSATAGSVTVYLFGNNFIVGTSGATHVGIHNTAIVAATGTSIYWLAFGT